MKWHAAVRACSSVRRLHTSHRLAWPHNGSPPTSLAGSWEQQVELENPGGRTNAYVFHAGAYGIPKSRASSSSEHGKKRKTKSLFAPLADFLIGGADTSPPPPQAGDAEPKLPTALSYLHGSGLQSAIRSQGKIVKTRLQSKDVGQDAYFLKNDAIGIADGVGGWAVQPHADPSLFSRLLMHFCYAEMHRLDMSRSQAEDAQGWDDALDEWFSCNPVEIMQSAWERCVRASKREGILGSSTALMAILRGDELRIANMGDCVLFLIRDGEPIFRSVEQQHSFNFPLQLGMMDATVESVTLSRALCMHRSGVIPDGARDVDLSDVTEDANMSNYINSYDQAEDSGSAPVFDVPRYDAGHWDIKVQPGDLVILASDGLLDNLFDDEIMDAVHDTLAEFDPSDTERMHMYLPSVLSERLCHMARSVMEDPRTISSPFQQHANEEGIYYVGGKNDDVTVVAGIISAQHETANGDAGGADAARPIIEPCTDTGTDAP